MNGFIGGSLRTARLFHGLSLQDLGEAVACSKQFLSRLESGIELPGSPLVDRLSEQLRVLPDFFYVADPMPITDEQCHFRKQLTTKVALRQVARARGEMLKRMVAILDDHLSLPRYDFISGEPSSSEEIEQLAERCRDHWELGQGPVKSVTRVAENAGAVVFPMSGLASEIDAISFATSRPVISFNAEGRSACRIRFGLAHEIGHLCLHQGVLTGDKLSESQANRFASAFLMPRRYFVMECKRTIRGTRLNWTALADLKMRWGVSKAAILYRGKQLGVFNDDQYRSGVIGLTRHGEARVEAEDHAIPVEHPEVVEEGLVVLKKSAGISHAAIARAMKVRPDLLSDLLAVTPQDQFPVNVTSISVR